MLALIKVTKGSGSVYCAAGRLEQSLSYREFVLSTNPPLMLQSHHLCEILPHITSSNVLLKSIKGSELHRFAPLKTQSKSANSHLLTPGIGMSPLTPQFAVV